MPDLEPLLRAIFEQSGVGVAQVAAPTGRFLRVNLRLADLLGYTVEELLTLGFPDITHPEDLAQDIAFMRRFVDGEMRGLTREKRYLHKNGTTVWVNVTVSPLWAPNETPTANLTFVEDISARKRAEAELRARLAALRESEERFRTFIDKAPEGVEVHDENGVLLDVNAATLAQLGYTRQELLGLSVFDVDPFVTRERFRDVMQAARLSPVRLESHHRRKDGSVFPVEVTITTLRMNGEVRLMTLVRDITERKQAEQALRDSEQRYRLLFEGLTDAVYIHPIGENIGPGTFEDVNPAACRLLGYTREELLKMTPRDIDAPESKVDVRVISERARRREAVLFEQTHVAKDGRRIPVEVSLCEYPVRGGGFGVLSVVRDITERRKAEGERAQLEAQFQQAQKMESIGRLAGGVAHDFNNMLQAILGNVDFLLGTPSMEADARDSLLEIHKSVMRSAKLTRQLLAFARRQPIHPEVLELNDTVSGMLKMLRRLIGEDVQLVWTPGAGLWSVEIDPVQIDQILANLAVNSRDAMPEGGRLTIETANVRLDDGHADRPADCPAGDYVRLSVTDTGSGMTPEVLAHVFEPFFTTKELGKGTGLGLATVFGIVRQNRGCLEVQSTPGEGTVFRCYLPRVHAVLTAPPPTVASRSPGGTETILLVEDDEQVMRLAQRILQKHGYRVLAALTPADAIQLAAAHAGEIQLLITDVIMPGMNGMQLRDRLAQGRTGMRVLFISGYPGDVAATHGLLDEGAELLGKPFTSDQLAVRVRALLSSSSPG